MRVKLTHKHHNHNRNFVRIHIPQHIRVSVLCILKLEKVIKFQEKENHKIIKKKNHKLTSNQRKNQNVKLTHTLIYGLN